jgi:energy-converting hydrogenase Eha subunit C
MLKDLFIYLKYPAVAGIICTIWIGSVVMIINDSSLPINKIIVINLIVSFFIGYIGFRVDRRK